MNVLFILTLVAGGLLVATGASLVFMPAGLVVGGVELAALALFVDDGKPS